MALFYHLNRSETWELNLSSIKTNLIDFPVPNPAIAAAEREQHL